jgi:selenocysteine lyase/cysteine desulfurase
MADISDYIGNAEQFPVLGRWIYFNHAGVAPLPKAVADVARRVTTEAESGAYLDTTWYPDIQNIRTAAAGLINSDKSEIALVKNTSEGISIVARGIDWQPGDRIVTAAVEYPANVYPWMEMVRTRGVELVMVPEQTDDQGRRFVPLEKILIEAEKPRTRMLTISHVEYASGQRHDLAVMGEFCHKRNILFNVDGIQSLGILPVDVKAMHIDFLSADGHKWLLGPEGAGIFFIRKELLEQIRPLSIGANSVINPQAYGDYDYTLKPDASRYESGTLNIPGMLAMEAAMKLLQSVGIENIAARCKQLTDRLIAGLELRGYQILSPRGGNAWSGIVSFVSPSHNHQQIQQMLRKQHKIEIAVRENRLRCSPHFYNTEAQIDAVIAALQGHESDLRHGAAVAPHHKHRQNLT